MPCMRRRSKSLQDITRARARSLIQVLGPSRTVEMGGVSRLRLSLNSGQSSGGADHDATMDSDHTGIWRPREGRPALAHEDQDKAGVPPAVVTVHSGISGSMGDFAILMDHDGEDHGGMEILRER